MKTPYVLQHGSEIGLLYGKQLLVRFRFHDMSVKGSMSLCLYLKAPRPLSSSFLGLPYRVLNINHKKELPRGLSVEMTQGPGVYSMLLTIIIMLI